MNDRAVYLLQILEKIGSPLMASILTAPGRRSAPDEQLQQDAVKMAELLAKTTQASIEMSQSMDFSIAQDYGDSLRVALAALASSLIGGYYRQNGKTPNDADIKKITAAMQAVLTFSDNFTPSPETNERLRHIEAGMPDMDVFQTVIQYVHTFIPAVNAINSFPFGQQEQKLIMDVSERLVRKASDVREAVFGDVPEGPKKWTELAILKSLVQIYAACHEAETVRLASAGSDVQSGGMDAVWKAFEIRAKMLEALALKMGESKGVSGWGSKSPAPEIRTAPAAAAAPPSPLPSPPQQSPTPPPVFTAPASPSPPAQPSAQPQAATPLSMFAKKPAEPPSPPPAQNNAPPPAATAQTPPETAEKGGSGPMSFFKKGEGQ